MANTIQQDTSGLWAEQDKDAFLDYVLDWSDWLLAGDEIAASAWSADPDLTLNSASFVPTKTQVWIQGGQPNKWYAVTNSVTTAQGRRDQRTIRLFVTNEADVVSSGTAVFPNRAKALDELRRDYIAMAAQNHLDGVSFEDDYLFDKLRAAESFAQRTLRCYLAPTVIIPDDAPQSEIDALEAAGTRYAQEAAYDYEPDSFSGDKWGYLVAKQRPIISVQSMKLVYPTPSNQVFDIPSEWIKVDRKYGHIRMVPTALSVAMPAAAFMLSAMGAGRTIPFMIHVRYTAGINDVHAQYPELVTAIKRMAVLNVLKDSFTPQSGSISVDGMSQSISADMDKYSDAIERTLDTVRDSIHGIRAMVL